MKCNNLKCDDITRRYHSKNKIIKKKKLRWDFSTVQSQLMFCYMSNRAFVKLCLWRRRANIEGSERSHFASSATRSKFLCFRKDQKNWAKLRVPRCQGEITVSFLNPPRNWLQNNCWLPKTKSSYRHEFKEHLFSCEIHGQLIFSLLCWPNKFLVISTLMAHVS